jgi:uncharacterized membrane protein
MKRFLSYFLRGLLIFVPLAVTIFVLVYVFNRLDNFLGDLFQISIPGLGLLVTICVITLIGFIASNFIGRKLFALVEKIFRKVPLVKMLYSSIKDLVAAFAGEKKKFDKPVLVTLGPGCDARVLGFITRDSLDSFGLTDHVAVYLPQSYNFAGNVLLVPKAAVQLVDVNTSEAMTFIVSGGLAGQ